MLDFLKALVPQTITPQWQAQEPAGVDPGMSFLSQVPQALLGRPSTGVLDFAKGAVYGLGSGDSGGANPGILASLGRIGMMALAVRQSKDPTAILRVKDYFDRQDAIKRDALAAPDAGNLTPEQFTGKYGFVPPTRMVPMNMQTGQPAGASDILGGRAQVMPRVANTPADMDKMLRYQQDLGRVQAAQRAGGPASFEGRQILETGTGPQERTVEAGKNFDAWVAEHPLDEKSQFIGYRSGPNGEVIKTIETRNNKLLDYNDVVESQRTLEEMGLAGMVANVPTLEGRTSTGEPLFSISPFSKPQRGGRGSGSPVNDYFRALVEQGSSMEDAARAAGKLGDLLAGDSGSKKDDVIGWYEDYYGAKFTPEEKTGLVIAYKMLSSEENEDELSKVLREGKGLPSKAEQGQAMIAKITQGAIARARAERAAEGGAVVSGEDTITNPNTPVESAPAQKQDRVFKGTDFTPEVVDGIIMQLSRSKDPRALGNFLDQVVEGAAFRNLSTPNKLTLASQVLEAMVRDPRQRIVVLDTVAKRLGVKATSKQSGE